jgi:hypothetical protein
MGVTRPGAIFTPTNEEHPMPGLTATAKTHWRDRITRAVERIRARHPALFDRIARDAHARALASLGLTDLYADLESIRAEELALARRRKQTQKAMLATLRSTPIDEVGDGFSVRYGSELGLPNEAADAIARRQSAHQEQLLADDPISREIGKLEAEKDALLDTVWLACSPAQIKQLWARVGELLGDEPTALEREALAIEPAKED